MDYRISQNIRRMALVCGVSAVALMSTVQAVEAADFKISAGGLQKALAVYIEQSGGQLIYRADDIRDIKTKGLTGRYENDDALKQLLDGTGFAVRWDASGAGVVVRAEEQQATQRSTPSSTKDATTNGSISGHVTEVNTGSNLAGALVRIVETGQTTKTDDLGNFSFPSVAAGTYTLSISYLGFASLMTDLSLGRGEEFQNEFSMGKSLGELDEIVVFGTRSARALALNLQRTAENNSEVISADMLGNFTGTTISEALRRVSGIAFQRDPLTGDGTNIFIRGHSPDMSAIKLNGLHLPVGSGIGRAPDLSTILADSVSKITIHKSLLPSHDSTGTGGLVEIETKTPLNRPHRYVSLSMEGDRKGGGFGDGFLASGTVAGTFGSDENFGLSASVQYRERDVKRFSYDTSEDYGQFLPLLETDDPDLLYEITQRDQVHPLTPFPFEPGADGVYVKRVSNGLTEAETSNLAVTLSAEWQVADHTNLNFDYQHSTANRSSYSRNNSFSAPLSYSAIPVPVAALGGEERFALGWNGAARLSQSYSIDPGSKSVNDSYSLRGRSNFGKWEFNYTLGYAHGSTSGKANISFNVDADQVALDGSLISAAAVDPVEGRIISPFGPRSGNGYPLPLLTDEGWAVVNDAASYSFRQGQIAKQVRGYNDRYTAKFSSKYDVDGKYLKYVEVGVAYESSKFGSAPIVASTRFAVCAPSDYFCSPSSYSFEDLGFSLDEANLEAIGVSIPGFNVARRSDVEAFFGNIPSLGQGEDPFLILSQSSFSFEFDAINVGAFTKEKSLAGYLQTRIDIGKLEIIGGVRINRVAVESLKLSSDTLYNDQGVFDEEFSAEFAKLVELNGSATEVLPRVQFNYRQNDNLVFRGSYYLSVARPGIEQLSDERSVSLDLRELFGPTDIQPELRITEGNPDLKPANTHNFDASIEYYDDDIGLIKLSGFYKRTTNQLETNLSVLELSPALADVVLPDHSDFQENLPDNVFIGRTRPENSPDPATVWGFEAHIERRFNFLPGVWNGFGIFANYSFTKSSRKDNYRWFEAPVLDEDGNFTKSSFFDVFGCFCNVTGLERAFGNVPLGTVPYNGAPRHSGTVALTYNKHNIDATLTYGFQGKYTSSFSPHNLFRREGGVGTLDFRISYYFEAGRGNYRVFFEGMDLLKSPGNPDLENIIGGTGNTPEVYTGARYLGGRTLKLGLSATF